MSDTSLARADLSDGPKFRTGTIGSIAAAELLHSDESAIRVIVRDSSGVSAKQGAAIQQARTQHSPYPGELKQTHIDPLLDEQAGDSCSVLSITR